MKHSGNERSGQVGTQFWLVMLSLALFSTSHAETDQINWSATWRACGRRPGEIVWRNTHFSFLPVWNFFRWKFQFKRLPSEFTECSDYSSKFSVYHWMQPDGAPRSRTSSADDVYMVSNKKMAFLANALPTIAPHSLEHTAFPSHHFAITPDS